MSRVTMSLGVVLKLCPVGAGFLRRDTEMEPKIAMQTPHKPAVVVTHLLVETTNPCTIVRFHPPSLVESLGKDQVRAKTWILLAVF